MAHNESDVAQGRKVAKGKTAKVNPHDRSDQVAAEGGSTFSNTSEGWDKETPFQRIVWTTDRTERKAEIRIIEDDGNSVIKPYRKLLVTGIRFVDSEKVSISNTNEGFVATFLDSGPVQLTVNAVLMNALVGKPGVNGFSDSNKQNASWRDEWIAYYREYFRGSALAKRNATLYLITDGLIFRGPLMNYSLAEDGNGRDNAVPLQFTMLTSGDDIIPVSIGIQGASYFEPVYPKSIDWMVQQLIKNQKYAYETKANPSFAMTGAEKNGF